MLEGKCPKCGTKYFGWALHNPRHQTCSKCGVALEITDEGGRVFTGFSPFTAERHTVNPPSSPLPNAEEKDSPIQET